MSYCGYLTEGEVNPDTVLALSLIPSTVISKYRHSFSSTNTLLMSGLSAAVGEVHNMAISTNFHAELTLNSPCNLGSTML
uniref:Uncharacterized protein n=1 Tax=Cajanus cajan TaxID=3821 RepID=A0A151S9P6_CAJCA|nr:hypothetical protein KK1_026653 [Cajanus cajan]